MLGVAAPVDPIAQIGRGDLPRVPVDQPVVGLFDLPTVVDLLVENAEFVADAVPDRRTLQGGQRVEIAGREPAQTAVAQPRLLFGRKDRVEVLAQRRERRTRLLLDLEIQQIVPQLRPIRNSADR